MIGCSEVAGPDHRHVDALLAQQPFDQTYVVEVHHVRRIKATTDELERCYIGPAALDRQHRAEGAIQDRDPELVKPGSVMLDEVFDVVSALGGVGVASR